MISSDNFQTGKVTIVDLPNGDFYVILGLNENNNETIPDFQLNVISFNSSGEDAISCSSTLQGVNPDPLAIRLANSNFFLFYGGYENNNTEELMIYDLNICGGQNRSLVFPNVSNQTYSDAMAMDACVMESGNEL